ISGSETAFLLPHERPDARAALGSSAGKERGSALTPSQPHLFAETRSQGTPRSRADLLVLSQVEPFQAHQPGRLKECLQARGGDRVGDEIEVAQPGGQE